MATIHYGDRTQELSLDQDRILNERGLIWPADTHAESLGDVYVICAGHSWAEVDAALDETDIFRSKPLAQKVFNVAFGKPRNARSEEYKLGVLNCLKVRLDGAKNITCPYPEGSAQADAYYAGVVEGRALAPVGQAPAGFNDADNETPLSLKL